ncbi:hypothetical protein GFY24_00580 [Nocardia sp. SYP-A9097]|uniref:hypothetical protein n=1 Tax=Nocardia sp. SYP-A9097 TaxID=2663237 RepID=UPI00129BBA6D|nr:hypothetical protein [Nocardia sp. SYP-A9097]MRH85974.1 hypothetical protein [Nocardia sp. SYP-A9097]
MLSKKFAATAALLIAALGVTAGSAGAAPEAADAGVINYTSTNNEVNTIIRTDGGSMVVEDGVFKIKAANGTTVAGTELNFRVDDYVFPIAAQISDHTATLTPEFVADKAVYKPINLPYENQAPFKSEYDREQAAWKRMTDTISMGATIATLVGGMGGAAVGCLIGGATAGAVTGTLTLMFGALGGAAVGCIVGMSVMGFMGTLAGQLFVTAPVAIMAAYNYFTTINQPFVAPK